jgi:hypothetical protein
VERARDASAGKFGALLLAARRHVRCSIRELSRRIVPGRRRAGLRFSAPIPAVAIAALALTSAPGLAEVGRDMVVRADRDANDTDGALLARYGLDPGTIERCEDVEALWRAVRELVLTQRLSEPMQQRILRRVWIADPETREGSFVDSASN